MNKQEYIKHYETVFNGVCDSIVDLTKKFFSERSEMETEDDNKRIKDIYSIFVNRETAEIDLEKMHACIAIIDYVYDESFLYDSSYHRGIPLLEDCMKKIKIHYSDKMNNESFYEDMFNVINIAYFASCSIRPHTRYLYINPHRKTAIIHLDIGENKFYIDSCNFYFLNKFDLNHFSGSSYCRHKDWGNPYRGMIDTGDMIDSIICVASHISSLIDYLVINDSKKENENE